MIAKLRQSGDRVLHTQLIFSWANGVVDTTSTVGMAIKVTIRPLEESTAYSARLCPSTKAAKILLVGWRWWSNFYSSMLLVAFKTSADVEFRMHGGSLRFLRASPDSAMEWRRSYRTEIVVAKYLNAAKLMKANRSIEVLKRPVPVSVWVGQRLDIIAESIRQ